MKKIPGDEGDPSHSRRVGAHAGLEPAPVAGRVAPIGLPAEMNFLLDGD
ncbi:hypothetical protein ACQPZQ_31805 [Pseudonocardia sp. CA-142604]